MRSERSGQSAWRFWLAIGALLILVWILTVSFTRSIIQQYVVTPTAASVHTTTFNPITPSPTTYSQPTRFVPPAVPTTTPTLAPGMLTCREAFRVIQTADYLVELAADPDPASTLGGLAERSKLASRKLLTRCPILTSSIRPAPAATPLSPFLLGRSTGGRPIEVHPFGDGPIQVAMIGGIHGGYEWNTILLAYQVIDYFDKHPEAIPAAISLYVIPVANPDGQAAVIGHTGRFSPDEVGEETLIGRVNANQVDLNRNWGCGWSSRALLGEMEISAGIMPFSEDETILLRRFITYRAMDAVLFWHSAVPGVFAGACHQPHPPSNKLTFVYARAAGYPFPGLFDAYPVTGDAANWLASQGIPAFIVELTNHTDTDWRQNLEGTLALLHYLAPSRGRENSQDQ